MATTGILNGTLLVVEFAGSKILHSTSFTLDLSHAPREATTKDSAGWRELLEGLRSWTISGEGMIAHDASPNRNVEYLFGLVNNRTKVTVAFTTQVTGDIAYTGDGYISALSQSSGVEESATFSFTLEGTAELTETTVT